MRVRPLNLLFLLGILLLVIAAIAAVFDKASIGTVLGLASFGIAFALLGGFRYW